MTYRAIKIIRRAQIERRSYYRGELDRRGERIAVDMLRQVEAGEFIFA